MKGGMRRDVTSRPLSTPITVPLASPATTPIPTEPVALIAVAARQALNPTFAPTDRSSPAVRMTSVSPDASRKTRLAWRRTLSRFDAVRNASLNSAKATHSNATTSNR